MSKILQEMGLPDYLTCLLRNLYAGQEAIVRIRHGMTDLHCWRKFNLAQLLWKSLTILTKVEDMFSLWPSNSISKYLPIKLHAHMYQGSWTRIFIAALLIITPNWKQLKCPSTVEWMRKLHYIHTMDYYTQSEWSNYC